VREDKSRRGGPSLSNTGKAEWTDNLLRAVEINSVSEVARRGSLVKISSIGLFNACCPRHRERQTER
jgi:hypothetical protein